jgi:hypothetical protein
LVIFHFRNIIALSSGRASAVLMNMFKSTFSFTKKNYRAVNAIASFILAALGVLMMTGYYERSYHAEENCHSRCGIGLRSFHGGELFFARSALEGGLRWRVDSQKTGRRLRGSGFRRQ